MVGTMCAMDLGTAGAVPTSWRRNGTEEQDWMEFL